MWKKVVFVSLAAIMIGGFGVSAFLVGRALWGDGATTAHGRGARIVEAAGPGQGWSNALLRGNGQGAGAQDRACAQDSTGEGTGPQAPSQQGQAFGGGQGRNRQAPGAGLPEADWVQLRGTVVSYDGELTIQTEDGTVLVGMGPVSFAAAQGFTARPGDEVVVTGFYEDGEYRAGQVKNLTTGQTLTLRQQDGHPLWAGQGRGRNRS